jgi:acyl CoA:acetate/3-ketoacid CoA transferase alpha subunit/acyl CoA:acetate/3-ketoacid CoA transferase beta subunit
MKDRLEQILQSNFALKENEGEDKVIPLDRAISENIKPGMSLHISIQANASICQIIRCFAHTRPEFTLTINAVTNHAINLVHFNLAKKLITSNCSFSYPSPGPVPLIQKAYKEGKIQIENWSSYALLQRLMAAALGLGFMPTRSMLGSTIASENADCFVTMEDPFDRKQTFGLVKALNPDISLVHGCVADRYGNTILPPPYAEGIWGPAASKNGAIVTVEQLVSTDFIRDHASFVHIPGYLVKSVSVVPYGAHPMGIINGGLSGFEGYGVDYDFLLAHRQACSDPVTLDAWAEEWILNCANHNDYLNNLGVNKLRLLKGATGKDIWRYELESQAESISQSTDYNQIEMMVVAAGRKMKERITEQDCRMVLTGIGSPTIAAWLAYYQLQNEGYGLDLIEGFGVMGYAPRPACPVFGHVSNTRTSKLLADIGITYGIAVAGRHNRCLSILGAAQLDKYGNINTSKIGDLYLLGPGGAVDAVNARETIVITTQSRNRFLERVPYVTCPGEKVKVLVSNMGIFEKLGGEEFVLTAYFPDKKLKTKEEAIKLIKENCGWELKVASEVAEVQPPGLDELMIIRLLDPKGIYLGR